MFYQPSQVSQQQLQHPFQSVKLEQVRAHLVGYLDHLL